MPLHLSNRLQALLCLCSLYLEQTSDSGQRRDPRRSLDLNPWG
jgi:hypothetical protein